MYNSDEGEEAAHSRAQELTPRSSGPHSCAGRAQCPAWLVRTDHGAHVGRCNIDVQGLIEEAHQFVTCSLVDRQPVHAVPPMLE